MKIIFCLPATQDLKKKFSTTTLLIDITNKLYKARERNECSCIVLFDIFRAFDCVHHGGLLFKLKQLGIVGNSLKLFANYLTNRSQHVSFCDITLGLRYVNCGVPQGSILGPLLFLIFVYDIHNNINSNIKLFSDDTTVLYSNPNPAMTHHILSEDLNQTDLWAKKWFVKFNSNKSKVLISNGPPST